MFVFRSRLSAWFSLYCRRLTSKMSGRSDPRVFLSKDSKGGAAVPASFEKCCLTVMGCSGNKMDVRYNYQSERLVIYPTEQGVKLVHPPACPCRFLTASDIANIPDSQMSQGVKAAVAVLLQSSDGHVLLTRRAEHMRTFPCVWVPPGGHIEPGETLNQAFLRELSEETGLTFKEGDIWISTLGLWESVFPAILSLGLPVRHHIVVYFLAQAREDHCTLQGRLNLQHNEVDAATWLDEATISEVARSDDFGQLRKVPQRYFRWCQNSCPEFTFWCNKYIFNQDHLSSAVQMSDCKQQWRQRDSAREPREFLEFVNESGRCSKAKIRSYSTVR